MKQTGLWNAACGIEAIGLRPAAAHYNQLPSALVQASVERGEGDLGPGGALVALTGEHTGRSPQDKFIVREASVEQDIW